MVDVKLRVVARLAACFPACTFAFKPSSSFLGDETRPKGPKSKTSKRNRGITKVYKLAFFTGVVRLTLNLKSSMGIFLKLNCKIIPSGKVKLGTTED